MSVSSLLGQGAAPHPDVNSIDITNDSWTLQSAGSLRLILRANIVWGHQYAKGTRTGRPTLGRHLPLCKPWRYGVPRIDGKPAREPTPHSALPERTTDAAPRVRHVARIRGAGGVQDAAQGLGQVARS